MRENNRRSIPSLLIFVGLCAVAFYLLLILPIPRQIGMIFRSTLYIFPILLLFFFAACRVQSKLFSPVLWALLFAFILAPYSALLNSGYSDQYALGRTVSWSDAFTMQLNTQRFLYGGTMGQASALRPISLTFYAAFLSLTGNNYAALYLFVTVLIALGILLCTRLIGKTVGNAAGAMFYTYMFFYVRTRLGTFMTEPYAVIAGLLTCYFLVSGISSRRNSDMLLGFMMLSLSMNARPAALFLFPCLGLWYFFVFLKNEPKRFVLAAAALCLMLSGFALNSYSQKYVYGKERINNRQAAEMIYGICLGGKRWGQVTGTREMVNLGRSEHMLKDLADLCLPILKEHPENLLKAGKVILWDSLIQSPYYGAFSFFNGNPDRFNRPIRFVLMGLWILGIIFCFYRKKDPLYSFLILSAAGCLLSQFAAVSNSSNYLRLYATSAWIPALIYGLPLEWLYGKVFRRTCAVEDDENLLYAGILSAILVVTAVFAPSFIKSHPLPIPEIGEESCREGETPLLTSVDPGSYFYMQNIESLQVEHLPYTRLAYSRQYFHNTSSRGFFEYSDLIEEPTAIIRGINLGDLSDVLIISPLELVEGKEGAALFCGEFIDPPIYRNDHFFIPESAEFLKERDHD